jgi:outer membrane protein assembly factor BamB
MTAPPKNLLITQRPLRWVAVGWAGLWFFLLAAPAKDWPQWGGTDGKNMISEETGLPESFAPGEKDSLAGQMKLETTKNVKWAVKLCSAIYSTPVVAGGRIFIGGQKPGLGLLMCLEEKTGKLLWEWDGPARKVPAYIDGFLIGIGPNPEALGVCSTPIVEGERVYFVTHSFKVMCLDVAGQPPGPEAGQARVLWEYDLWDKLGVFPCDAANGSPVIDGDLLYVQTSNGVDRNMGPAKEIQRKIPAPNAPNLIVLEKKTGRLVATDGLAIADRILHGQWSPVSLGTVAGQRLVFFGAGDGRCYAFEALASTPEKPVKLKTVWSYDCIPPEYRSYGGLDAVWHYCLGDKRCKDTLNKNDGMFVGESEIIGTPVFHRDRIYVAIGRDPEHARQVLA